MTDRAALQRAAVHAAGHALLVLRLGVAEQIFATVHFCAAEWTSRAILVEKMITLDQLLNLIAVALAGRAAEEIVFGEVSSLSGGLGTDNDLARATGLATDAVTKLGLSAQFGLYWHDPARGLPCTPEFRDETQEIKAMLEAAYAYAKKQLEGDLEQLGSIAEMLIDNRYRAGVNRYTGEFPRELPAGNLPDRVAGLLRWLDAASDRLVIPRQVASVAIEAHAILELAADDDQAAQSREIARRPEHYERNAEVTKWLESVQGIEFQPEPEPEPESFTTRAKALVRLFWKRKGGEAEIFRNTRLIKPENV
ncbi:MAG: hypothetical protein ACKVP7_19955 [Hyphomicrobiaceae bacterium]